MSRLFPTSFVLALAVLACAGSVAAATRPSSLARGLRPIVLSKHRELQGSTTAGAASPVAPTWPDAFSIAFNVSVMQFHMFAAPSKLYYDYTIKSERIDFGECSANGVRAPCTVIFTPTTGYLMQAGKCCVAAPVGTVQPTWLHNLHYNGTAPVFGETVNWWRGASPIHNYYVDPNNSSRPLVLLVEDIMEEWVFTTPIMAGPQDPSLFRLPSVCAHAASC